MERKEELRRRICQLEAKCKTLETELQRIQAENTALKTELQQTLTEKKDGKVIRSADENIDELIKGILIGTSGEAFSELLVQYDSPKPAITSKVGRAMRELIVANSLSNEMKDKLYEFITANFKIRKNTLRYKKPSEKILSLTNLIVREHTFSESKENEVLKRVNQSLNDDNRKSTLQRYPWLAVKILGIEPIKINTKIEELYLSQKTYYALKQSNLNSVKDIITYPSKDFFDNGKSIKNLKLENAKEVSKILRIGGIVYSA